MYWLQFKRSWDTGGSEQIDEGGKEADKKPEMEKRMEYGYSKLEGTEYGNAIGAMEKGYDKVSSNFNFYREPGPVLF